MNTTTTHIETEKRSAVQSRNQRVPKLRFKEFDGEWEKNRLNDIAEFKKGKGISKADITEDGALECIRYGELYTTYTELIQDVVSKTNLPIKDLLLSEFNDVIIPASGESNIDIATASCVLKSGVAFSGDLNIIRSKMNGIFLSFYLNNKRKFDIARLAQGVSVVHLYSSQLKTLKINLPTLPEQQKIASFLSAVDEKIQQLSKKKALLEDYKKGVMQQVFSGKLRFKDENGKDYPDWEEKRLGDFVLSHKGGASLKPVDFRSYSEFEVIPKKAICAGGNLALDKREPTFCSESFYLSNQANVIDKSYLITTLRDLVPSGPSIGFIVQYNSNVEYILAQGVYAILIDENRLSRGWIIQFSNTVEFRKVMQTIMVGSTQVHIRNQDYFKVKLSLPSLVEQQKIASFLSSIDTKIESVSNQISQTQSFKKGLLQQLFV